LPVITEGGVKGRGCRPEIERLPKKVKNTTYFHSGESADGRLYFRSQISKRKKGGGGGEKKGSAGRVRLPCKLKKKKKKRED